MIQMFIIPIRSQELMTRQQLAVVFGNLESLIPINEAILLALEKRRRTEGPVVQCVGDIFLKSVRSTASQRFQEGL